VLAAVVALCSAPAGKHPLSAALAGWNTVEVLGGHRRVVFRVSAPGGVGLVEVLCLGPRADGEVCDLAAALAASGLLDGDRVTQLWDALAVLDVVAEKVGLDGWDYAPLPAPEGQAPVRSEPRCDAVLPRARSRCIRRRGHPGPHRSGP
jgi:hypothetical protein